METRLNTNILCIALFSAVLLISPTMILPSYQQSLLETTIPVTPTPDEQSKFSIVKKHVHETNLDKTSPKIHVDLTVKYHEKEPKGTVLAHAQLTNQFGTSPIKTERLEDMYIDELRDVTLTFNIISSGNYQVKIWLTNPQDQLYDDHIFHEIQTSFLSVFEETEINKEIDEIDDLVTVRPIDELSLRDILIVSLIKNERDDIDKLVFTNNDNTIHTIENPDKFQRLFVTEIGFDNFEIMIFKNGQITILSSNIFLQQAYAQESTIINPLDGFELKLTTLTIDDEVCYDRTCYVIDSIDYMLYLIIAVFGGAAIPVFLLVKREICKDKYKLIRDSDSLNDVMIYGGSPV